MYKTQQKRSSPSTGEGLLLSNFFYLCGEFFSGEKTGAAYTYILKKSSAGALAIMPASASI